MSLHWIHYKRRKWTISPFPQNLVGPKTLRLGASDFLRKSLCNETLRYRRTRWCEVESTTWHLTLLFLAFCEGADWQHFHVWSIFELEWPLSNELLIKNQLMIQKSVSVSRSLAVYLPTYSICQRFSGRMVLHWLGTNEMLPYV